MKIKTILFAETIIREVGGDKLSAIRIIDDFTPAGFPMLFPSFCILIVSERTKRESKKNRIEIVIRMAKKKLFEGYIDIDYQDRIGNRAIYQIFGITIPSPGRLQANIIHKGKKIGTHYVNVSAPAPRAEKK